MPSCRICSVELDIKTNWTLGLKRDNSHICKNCHRDISRDYRNSLTGKFNTYKIGARRRNIEFYLNMFDFASISVNPCYYCGNKDSIYNGVDRKDCNVGYCLDNCVACCKMCNHMKQEYNSDDFINKCMEVSNHASKRM